MNCTICHQTIELVPSAEERARKSGQKPSFFRQLFTEHATCALKKRGEETLELVRRIHTSNRRTVKKS
jgi:phosphoribosyl-ATP pyrophosphohydrolase